MDLKATFLEVLHRRHDLLFHNDILPLLRVPT